MPLRFGAFFGAPRPRRGLVLAGLLLAMVFGLVAPSPEAPYDQVPGDSASENVGAPEPALGITEPAAGTHTPTQAADATSLLPTSATTAPQNAGVSNSDGGAGALPIPPTGAGRLVIPSIGVSARITEAGPPINGQLQAPADADSVVWYGFSAVPGQSGNALIAGHVDLGQRTAVFWDLRLVRPGDTIIIESASGALTYVVERSYTVRGDTSDTANIIGTRSGPPTITLITCDGSFVASTRSYDQRRIVVASLRG